MLVIVEHPDIDVPFGESGHERVDRTVTSTADDLVAAVDAHRDIDLVAFAVCRRGAGTQQLQRGVHVVTGEEVLTREDLPQLRTGHLAAGTVGVALHDAGELDLQPARQVQRVLRLQQVGDTALTRLAVHADDSLV